MSQENVTLVQEAVNAFARRDNNEAVRNYSEDIVWDMSQYAGWPGPWKYQGLEEIRQFHRAWIAPWEEWSWEPSELLDVGDHVLVVGRDRGRLAGSTAEVERTFAQVWTVSDGSIIRIANFRTRAEAIGAVGLSE